MIWISLFALTSAAAIGLSVAAVVMQPATVQRTVRR